MSEIQPPAPGSRLPEEPSNATPEVGSRQPVAGKAPRWAWWVATGFGSGYLKPAPGTWGSLAAIIPWLILHLGLDRLVPIPDPESVTKSFFWLLPIREGLDLALLIGLIWVSVRAADLVSIESRQKDPSFIVADEWAGMWITLWPLHDWHMTNGLHDILLLGGLLGLAFLLFRIFDIWKPWPIHQIQVLPGGQGIVADDIVAGLYAALLFKTALELIMILGSL